MNLQVPANLSLHQVAFLLLRLCVNHGQRECPEYILSDRSSGADHGKHGIPRVSGSKPVSDQGRRKELRKIEEYRTLVNQISRDVSSLRLL